MNRKSHIVGGFVTWSIALLISYFIFDLPMKTNSMWILLSLFICQFGSQMPDYDVIWKKILPHRNIITHSFFLPAISVLPIYFVVDSTNMLLPLYAFFLFGYASHLILDLHVKGWMGTACIRVFWKNKNGSKSMNGTKSFIWLLTNGLILIAGGIIIMFYFNVWI